MIITQHWNLVNFNPGFQGKTTLQNYKCKEIKESYFNKWTLEYHHGIESELEMVS